MGWIDARDIAESAAAVLVDPERDFDDEYVLTGPQALSYSDAAGIIAAETGRPVRVIDVDVDEVAAHLREAGIPASFAGSLAGVEISVRKSHAEGATTSVQDLTGRGPRTFTAFVHEHADEWAAPSRNGDPLGS
ncbi:hypothetical protein [Pseudonocardia sp. MH-G8]|uniref:hypothetical protein n=1 Tax=Pseudonocardia sp. MH-G8 TaxID=1854588 RepID=UPI000B9FDCC4|nr:hypothetical protein [Pseudonocardia sp. MH-G8]OZM80788.1 hypothetical protein CFP66_18785 [Pseudonocardia sp. MH-G8]